MRVEAFYLSMDGERRGRRFCLFHPPQSGAARAAFVYVHPFAEEMNKSRRMAALQARALSAAGCAVLQIDLLGCGDSDGDFADATWSDWIEDVVEAARWLRERADAPLWLWGLRAGCLLASEAATRIDAPSHCLFWQAPSQGSTLLQQFLRLKAAGDMLEGKSKGAVERSRAELDQGASVDVGGYRLAPALAAGLDAARLVPPPAPGRLEWLELSSRAEPVLSAASQRTTEQWRDSGWEVRSRVLPGLAFWQTSEIEEVPGLVHASTHAWAELAQTFAT